MPLTSLMGGNARENTKLKRNSNVSGSNLKCIDKPQNDDLIKSFVSNEGSQIEMEEIDMRLKALEDLLGKDKTN